MAENAVKIHNLGFGFLGHHPVEELTELVRTAEELGFTSAWIAEDYFYAGAFSLASAVARSTEKIQLGIGVINPYTRHPVLSAMEAAALDTVSKGRAIIGIGAANKLWIETRMGMPYSKPITATRECVEIIKGLVGQGKLTYHGSVFHVEGVELEFQPYRRDLPVYMGVKGDKALFQAGQAADGVLISAGCTLEYISYARNLIAQGARSVGRNPEELRLAAYLPTCIRPTHQEAVDVMRPFVRRYLGLHGDKPILTCAGFDPAVLRPSGRPSWPERPVPTRSPTRWWRRLWWPAPPRSAAPAFWTTWPPAWRCPSALRWAAAGTLWSSSNPSTPI